MSSNASRLGSLILAAAMAGLWPTAASAQLRTQKVLSYEAAKLIASTAVEACLTKGFHVSAVVVDRDGETVALLRGDGAGPHTVENARRKAYTANSFKTDTTSYAKRFADNEPLVRQQVTLPSVIAIAGGLPIKSGEEVVGGAGVSGSPNNNDEPCVQAGLDKAKDLLQ
ncbi:MAG TPA: heme-binding protein [Aliidongia sp.]|uniref:GlcG/HbpS family heme-binding protein n=1 Tax=Aliidongia sp. TaxID=1914230 RepID=UPI002DDD0DBF|nr:heme-binding protein [Aliidongia sp.]HEV2678341.1 heme-binding protein [Aliidongia sp.]